MNLGQSEVVKDTINNALDTVSDFSNQQGLEQIKLTRDELAKNKINQAIKSSKKALLVYAHEQERDAQDESDFRNISNDLVKASDVENILGNLDLASRLDIVSYGYFCLYAIKHQQKDETMQEAFIYNELPHDLDKIKINQSTRDEVNNELDTVLFSHNVNQAKQALKEIRKALL